MARWYMPQETSFQSLYYSINVGPLHLVMSDTESAIDTPQIDDEEARLSLHLGNYYYCCPLQFHWMTADLISANANRTVTPWIVTAGHRFAAPVVSLLINN
jgi:hypothetical protein